MYKKVEIQCFYCFLSLWNNFGVECLIESTVKKVFIILSDFVLNMKLLMQILTMKRNYEMIDYETYEYESLQPPKFKKYTAAYNAKNAYAT